VREHFPERVAEEPQDGMPKPDDIAEVGFHIHQRNAWTIAVDLWPLAEKS